MQRVEETAYAKLNLTLAVTGRRADGYHTIQSLFQSISLCDRLVLERREIGFTLNDVEKIPAGENIITRADRLLRREFPNLGGVAVMLEKNIPTEAGLGGRQCGRSRLSAWHEQAVRTGTGKRAAFLSCSGTGRRCAVLRIRWDGSGNWGRRNITAGDKPLAASFCGGKARCGLLHAGNVP